MNVSSFERLERIYSRLVSLNRAVNLINWDFDVLSKSVDSCHSASSLITLKSLYHSILHDDSISDLIKSACENKKKLNVWQNANLDIMQREHKYIKSVPLDLLEEFEKSKMRCRISWNEACLSCDNKQNLDIAMNDFCNLNKLACDIASVRSEAMNCSKYDSFLLAYDADFTSTDLDKLFEGLGSFLESFIPNVIEKQLSDVKKPLKFKGKFPFDKQKELWSYFSELVGYEIEIHPLKSCFGTVYSRDDFKIAVGINENDFVETLVNIMQKIAEPFGINQIAEDYRNQPLCYALGGGIKEAIAMLFSHYIGTSRSFISFIHCNNTKKIFGGRGKSWDADNIYKLLNSSFSDVKIQPSDEIIYPVHIMSCYSLEKSLIENELKPQDILDAWSDDMKHYLDLKVKRSDFLHSINCKFWRCGIFGLAPVKLLGSIIASNIFVALNKSINLDSDISGSTIKQIITWISDRFYKNSFRYSTKFVLRKSIGLSKIDSKCYSNYLNKKFLD